MVSLVLQSKLDDLPAERRARARAHAERLIEQVGFSEDAAMSRALSDVEPEDADQNRFRRAGLRWDE